MTSLRRSRLAVAAAAFAAAALLLSGCADQQAGSAATLGDDRISEQSLTAQVEEVLAAKGQPVTSADQSLVQQTLGRMITIRLIDRLAVVGEVGHALEQPEHVGRDVAGRVHGHHRGTRGRLDSVPVVAGDL